MRTGVRQRREKQEDEKRKTVRAESNPSTAMASNRSTQTTFERWNETMPVPLGTSGKARFRQLGIFSQKCENSLK